jgi:superfamily I DNA/RNA helicase
MKNNDIIDEKLSSIKNIIKKKNLNEYVGKEEADVKVEEQVLATCDKNIRIIACAGSGKTYLMVKKTISLIEQDKYNLSKIIVTTFTDLAANELKREIYYKIIKKGIYNSDKEAYQNLKKMFIGTIHGLCLKYLKMLEKDEINYNEMNILNESNIKLLIYRYYSNPDLNITKILPFSRKIIRNFGNSNLIIPDYLHMIYKISEETISLKNYKQDENIPSSILNMFDLFSSFILKKKYLTFSLITRKFVDCFKNKDSQMWKLISNIKYLIIDEFQDINPIQQKIVEIFLSNNSYVYVVGDEDQAIYQFRGGSEKFLTDFVKNAESINQNKILDVKKANTRRCTSGIVYLADSIINQNSVHELFSGYRDEKVLKSISPLSDQEGDMTKVVYETEEEEINSVIEQAKSYHDLKGVKYNNIAIILRKNKDVEKFCFELEKKKIPYERKENGGIFDYLGFENEAYKAFTFIIEIRNKKGKFEGYEKKKAKIKNNPYISHSLFEFLENLPDLTFIENVEQIFELNQKYLKNKIYEQENIIHLIQYLQKNKEEKIDNIKKYFLDDKRIPLIIKYKGKHPISFSFYKIFLLLKDISKSYNSYVVSEILQNIFGFVDKEKKEALLSYINKYQNELYKIENIIAKTTKTNHELLYFLKQIIILVNVKDISDKNKYYEFLLNTEQIANIIQDYEEVYQGVGKIQKIYDFIEFLDNANDSYSYLFPESEDDKINVLTAHGSKGLGFYITFLPFLNKDSFPSSISVDEECDKFGCYEK